MVGSSTLRSIGVACALLCGVAHAGVLEDAKAYYEQGLSAYALGNYPEAAIAYEKAFAVKPDPALLYNAAQSHRLAGNKPRALLLYQNYLRLFDKQRNRDEVQRHIVALNAAIESDKRATASPPTEVAPVGKPVAAPPPDEPPSHPVVSHPDLAATLTAPPPQKRQRVKPWVIGVVVGAVAAVGLGVGLGLGLGLSGGPQDPSGSFGTARLH